MNSLSAARAFIGDSLAFHIIFALFGIGLPIVLCIVECMAEKYKDAVLLHVARTLSKIMVLLVIIGVVSGTLIALQMYTIWPGLIKFGHDIIGVPFMLEGYAFLIEVIFLSWYIASWKKRSGYRHALILIPVVLGAILSAVCITVANAWMNAPSGFTLVDGKMTDIHVWKGLMTMTAFFEVTHSILAYIMTTFIAVLAALVFAVYKGMQRTDGVKRVIYVLAVCAFVTQLALGAIGDMSLRYLSSSEPNKFAAIELVEQSGSDQSFRIGGRFNSDTQKVEGAITVPHMLSLMTGFSTETTLKGLTDIPEKSQPLTIVHTLFEIKMGLTFLVILTTLVCVWGAWKRKPWMYSKRTSVALIFSTLASIALVELGWMLTELGRQPYAVNGLLSTAEAFVGDPRVIHWGAVFPTLFVILFVVMILSMRRIIRKEV